MLEDAQKIWSDYVTHELAAVTPILAILGYDLEPDQPHIRGERFLMQAVTTTSGKKIILLGRDVKNDKRVVIKATRDAAGMQELTHERVCRKVITEIKFAYKVFHTPREILFEKKDGFLISIQEYIAQDSAFLDRTLRDQFFFALRAFEAQEGAHATTYEHMRLISRTFGTMSVDGYIARFAEFKERVLAYSSQLEEILTSAESFLQQNKETIDQYSGFLTHTDFVPHNFRINGNDMYLLDYSSLRFGNKYEGWARFLNFMALYNPELESALSAYVRDNRTSEESLSLKLMRVYRLGEIISYYVSTLEKSSGNLHELNAARVQFWGEVLQTTLRDTFIEASVREEYKKTRDTLRSDDEKKRQIGLH